MTKRLKKWLNQAGFRLDTFSEKSVKLIFRIHKLCKNEPSNDLRNANILPRSPMKKVFIFSFSKSNKHNFFSFFCFSRSPNLSFFHLLPPSEPTFIEFFLVLKCLLNS